MSAKVRTKAVDAPLYANGLLMLRVLASAPADTEVTDLRILLTIASRTDEEGANAWPDNAEIVRHAACSERTVNRRLKVLLSQGWFTRSRKYIGVQRWRWNYTLTPPSKTPPSYTDVASSSEPSKTPPSNTTVAPSPWRSSKTPPLNTIAPKLDATVEYKDGATLIPRTPVSNTNPPKPPRVGVHPTGRSAEPSTDAQPDPSSVPTVHREAVPGPIQVAGALLHDRLAKEGPTALEALEGDERAGADYLLAQSYARLLDDGQLEALPIFVSAA